MTDRELYPAFEGNRARIIELVRALRGVGVHVTLLTVENPGWRDTLRTRALVDRLVTVRAAAFPGGSPTRYDCGPFRAALARAIAASRPRAVIAEYLWMAPCLDVVEGPTLRLVDTHDVMHVRGPLYGDHDAWVFCSASEEAALLRRADVVIAIQPNERARLRDLVPDRRVICVPHCRPVIRARPADAGTRIVAFIGSPNPANRLGLRWLLDDVWPQIKQRCPLAVLHVYGYVGDGAARTAAGADVSIKGYVADLRRAYATAAVVVNPVRLGTGLKIKTVEALSAGAALVTTACGCDGLEDGAGKAFLVADDAATFADAVAALLSDVATRRRLAAAAHEYAVRTFGARAALRELLPLLDGSTEAPC